MIISDANYVLALESQVQRDAEVQPMSREEVKATLIRVRQMRDRIHFIASGVSSSPGF